MSYCLAILAQSDLKEEDALAPALDFPILPGCSLPPSSAIDSRCHQVVVEAEATVGMGMLLPTHTAADSLRPLMVVEAEATADLEAFVQPLRLAIDCPHFQLVKAAESLETLVVEESARLPRPAIDYPHHHLLTKEAEVLAVEESAQPRHSAIDYLHRLLA